MNENTTDTPEKQPQDEQPTQPQQMFALAHMNQQDGDIMPWLCYVDTANKVGGPMIFSSIRYAESFRNLRGERDYAPVQLTREQFYKLAGEAMRDGFNAFIVNPHAAGGKFVCWQIGRLLDGLPRNDPCPCGSAQKTKLCCAAPPPHRYTPRRWPVVTPTQEPKPEGQGKNERTSEDFSAV